MKQFHLISSLGFVAAALSLTVTAGASEWQVDESGKVAFSFTQQGTKYTGRFATFTANINIDPANIEGGSIVGTVQTDSVNTRDYDRDATLVEVDWFDSANYPEAVFESNSISVGEEGGYVAEGSFTLKGITRPMNMNFTFEPGDASAVFAATMRINRFTFKVGDGWNDTSWIGQYVDVDIELDLTQ